MYNKTVLDNGLRIVTERLPHSRLVSVGVWVDVGSRDEHDLNNGCAHFVEHMFFKGTQSRTAQQIARELDVLGGAANAFTSRENTCYYATVLDSHLAQLVPLLADLFLNSLFSQDDIDRERQVILQEISMVEDTPDDQIHDLFASLLWGRHPLGNTVLGGRGVVSAMDSKKLTDYVKQYYTPNRILISAAGNVDHDEFVGLWKDLNSIPGPPDPENGKGVERRKPVEVLPQRQVYGKPLEQVHIILGTYGLPSPAAERYAYLLLNVLLGGNMSSRLFQEVREKRGLVYSIYSYISSYVDSGYISIYLGVDKESLNEALSLAVQEVQKLLAEPVGSEELENVKEFVKAGLYLSADNMEAIMMRIARNELTFGRYISLDEVVSEIDRVDPSQVGRLAGRLFQDRDLTMAALGPLDSDEIDWPVFKS